MQSDLKAAFTFDCDFGAKLGNLLWIIFPPKMNSSVLQSESVVAKATVKKISIEYFKMAFEYRPTYIRHSKVASSALSRLVAHFLTFRLFMNGKFDAYIL